MYSVGFNEQFADQYDFVEFAQTTGLKAPHVGEAYKKFKQFSWEYVCHNKLDSMSECFEVWLRGIVNKGLKE